MVAASLLQEELFLLAFLGFFGHWSFCCNPNIVIFALVGKLIVLFKIFTNLKVIRNFPAYFAHWFAAFGAVHG